MLCEHATASGRCYRYYARRNGGVESRYSIQTLAHPQTTETKEKKKILRGFFSRISIGYGRHYQLQDRNCANSRIENLGVFTSMARTR